jgi:hypothetical protein
MYRLGSGEDMLYLTDTLTDRAAMYHMSADSMYVRYHELSHCTPPFTGIARGAVRHHG